MAQPSSASPIHIIDDEESVRVGLERLIRSCGMLSELYESPEVFLQEVSSDTRGCILMDITMPGMNGIEFLKRLQEIDCGMPVIVISARDDEEIKKALKKLGVRFFLRKPVDDQALIDAISWVSEESIGGPSISDPG